MTMMTSPRSDSISATNCRRSFIILLVAQTVYYIPIVCAASVAVNPAPVFSGGVPESTAVKTSSSSASVVGVPVATPSGAVEANGHDPTMLGVVADSYVGEHVDGLASQSLRDDLQKVRTKRDWKTSRIKAAWGKRTDEEATSSVLKVADSRRRRKWNQVGRQAWGKRDSGTDMLDRLPDALKTAENDDEEAMLESAFDADTVPVRSTRKWGVGSAKAAWGKRKWGASNDMRVWGKRSVKDEDFDTIDDGDVVAAYSDNKFDDNIEQQETGSESTKVESRTKRSMVDGDLGGQSWTFNDQLLPEDAMAAKRIRLSAIPSTSAFRRGYIGPKRNWQTNTMKVWGKRSVTPSLSTKPYFSDEDEKHVLAREPEELPYVWNGVEDDAVDKIARKRAWSSDNSLRVWGK